MTPVDDAVAEGPETLSIGGSVTVTGLTVTAATVTLIDDEGTPTVTLLLTPASIRESDDAETPSMAEHVSTVTAALSNVSSADTVVTVAAEAVLPALPADFTLSANKTLTIAAGATTSSGTVTLSANDNSVDAPGKTVTVSGSASNSAGVTDPSGQTLSITDDEAAPSVTLLLTPSSIRESDDAETPSISATST